MKTVGVLVCVGAAMFCTGIRSWGQNRPAILVVVPEDDSTTTASSVYRLSASAAPNSRVTLNGQPQFVYPSGAFCGLLPLAVGENRFTVVATSVDSSKAEKTFVIVRTPPPVPLRFDTLAIDSIQMRPAQDRWLDAGQLLEVECRGTPGCKATFLDGVPMTEFGADGARGGRGVYRGVYRVGEGDHLLNTPITFRLEDSLGHVVERSTTARVSFRSSDFPLVAVTRGDRPLLYYGLGDDRLGGAVLQRLVAGVRLAINGKTGTMYRVALGDREEAWIDEESVSLLPQGTYPPYSLTGNWNVYGDSLYDYVTVAMNDRLPYVSNPDIDPGHIVVDVYGAVANTNWIIQTLTTREITNVSYRENGKGDVRITIGLRHQQLWGYSIAYRGSMLVIRVRRQPEHLKIKALRFIVDAGHGGDNNGALGSTGVKEKDINLATALHLKEILEDRGATVLLTRGADSSVSMARRLSVATRDDADMLISVHANSIGYATNPADVRGVSTYYKYLAYRPLSLCILHRILGLDLPATGNVGSFNFYLNSVTEMPTVLVEQAYMSNPLDEMKLMDDDFRKELARAIVKGIQDFLDGCEE
ncbi:MAG TPA: N-acetylmuramoyl-L-alanine amidase [Bacteroidota bacterium]|nr:N-acetylmuramoyl-L-alanine amidase [Bacteroidota bacterium]